MLKNNRFIFLSGILLISGTTNSYAMSHTQRPEWWNKTVATVTAITAGAGALAWFVYQQSCKYQLKNHWVSTPDKGSGVYMNTDTGNYRQKFNPFWFSKSKIKHNVRRYFYRDGDYDLHEGLGVIERTKIKRNLWTEYDATTQNVTVNCTVDYETPNNCSNPYTKKSIFFLADINRFHHCDTNNDDIIENQPDTNPYKIDYYQDDADYTPEQRQFLEEEYSCGGGDLRVDLLANLEYKMKHTYLYLATTPGSTGRLWIGGNDYALLKATCRTYYRTLSQEKLAALCKEFLINCNDDTDTANNIDATVKRVLTNEHIAMCVTKKSDTAYDLFALNASGGSLEPVYSNTNLRNKLNLALNGPIKPL